MPDFYLVATDRLPVIEITCLDAAGDPVDLTDATVQLHYRVRGGSTSTSRTATVYDGPNGICRYAWTASDVTTMVAGIYDARVVATFPPNSLQISFPNHGTITIEVAAAI